MICVQKLIADMNDVDRPPCLRADTGGQFTSRRYVEHCDSAESALSTRHLNDVHVSDKDLSQQ